MKRPVHLSDLRGFSRLAVEATIGVTDLVEEMHRSVTSFPASGARNSSRRERMRGITGFVYRTVRRITRWVGGGVDRALAKLQPLLLAGVADAGYAGPAGTLPAPASRHRDALLAALNGVLGDHLEASGNPLAIPMQFRRDGQAIDPAHEKGGRILLLVHGLCRSDVQWVRKEHNHGARLAAELGFTDIYLHYNSGRSIASNGRELAERLETLLQAWPEPVTELVVVAHSMGGLVIRSACHVADTSEGAALLWRDRLRKIIFLATPHLGAPLERGGNWVTLALDKSSYTAAFARLGRIRSAGITDLRHGQVLPLPERDHFARASDHGDSVPLPEGVACYAAAATLAPGPDPGARSKVSTAARIVLGDGLVPLASGLGDDPDPAKALTIPTTRRFIGYGMNHLDLLDRREVYERIRKWLAEPTISGTLVAR